MKKGIQWALLLLVVAGFVAAGMKSRPSGEPTMDATPASTVTATVTSAKAPVTVTYFTTDARCVSCRKIEDYTKLAVDRTLEDQTMADAIHFQTINVDFPENQHFIADYDIAFKTVVISYLDADGKQQWQKMDRVWELLSDPIAFQGYLHAGIQDALSKASS
jgi:ABC-type glycerol-3-phosphate transport system substrate-binding protein